MHGQGCSPILRIGGRPWLAVAVVLGFVLLLLVPARPAYAHAQLLRTAPANGARLPVAPADVVLTFSERVTLVRDGVRLLGAGGQPVRGGRPARVDADGTVHLPVPPGLASGVYTVSWRVVSADSHPLHGAFVFAVGDAQFGTIPDGAARVDADHALSTVFWLFRWLGYAGLALLAGGVAFLVLCWPAGWTRQRARRLLAAGWVLSAACAVAVLLLQGPYAAGRTLAGLTDTRLLSATLGTDYGRSMVVRLGLLVIGGALLLGTARAGERRATAALLLGLALPATWIGTGHANAQVSPLSAVADGTHLAAMASWFGGLAMLVACVLPRTAPEPVDAVAGVMVRFSRLATICVGALVVTGTFHAWRGVGSIAALAGSAYGTLLVYKLAAVAVLLWLGLLSRSVVRRRYVLPVVRAAAPVASRSVRRAERDQREQDLLVRHRLRWSVRLEVLIGLAVLAVTAMLVSTPPATRGGPPEPAAAPAPAVATATLALSGGGEVEVRLDPAQAGTSTLTLTVRRVDGGAWDVPEVTAALELPAQDLGPLPVRLTRVDAGRYGSQGLSIPVAGTWGLSVSVRTSEIDRSTVETELVVG